MDAGDTFTVWTNFIWIQCSNLYEYNCDEMLPKTGCWKFDNMGLSC